MSEKDHGRNTPGVHDVLLEVIHDGRRDLARKIRLVRDKIQDLESDLDEEEGSPWCDGSGAPEIRRKLNAEIREHRKLMSLLSDLGQAEMILLVYDGRGGDIRPGPDGKLVG